MIKKWVVGITAGMVVFSGVAFVYAGEMTAPKPEKGMIIGDVIELSTYAMKGHGGEIFTEAGRDRAEKGFPVGILEESTGEVWIAVYRSSAPASHLEKANKHLIPLMGQKVAVQGLKYKAKGVNLIRLSLISEY